MNIIACYKIVPDEQDIMIRPDQSLSLEKAELQIGQYDLNAVEAGIQLFESTGGNFSALSAGGNSVGNSKLKKGILSRGPQALYLVKDPALENPDIKITAIVLAAAIQKISGYDLILCGEGSSDLYAQQVGIQVGQILGIPTINAVSKIIPNGDTLIVERTLENDIEVLEIPLPAVISVTTDINVTRVPSMKDILAAGKKPVTEWTLADLNMNPPELLVEPVSTLAPKLTDRKKIILHGDDEQQIVEFYKNIRSDLN